MDCGAPEAQGPARSQNPLAVDAEIEVSSVNRFGKGISRRCQTTTDSAGFPVLQRRPRREEETRPGAI